MSRRIPVLAIVVMVLAAACTGGGASPAPTTAPTTATSSAPSAAPTAAGPAVPVKVAWVKAAAQSALPVAIAKGFDKEFGIALEAAAYPTAPEAVQAAVTGAANAAYGAAVPTGPALIAEGAPIQCVQIYAYGGNRVGLVAIDPAITTVADLEGKTVATAVGSDPEQFLLRALEASGVDESKVSRVNMQYADMPAAIVTNQVAAATITEPGLSTFLGNEPKAHVIERAAKYISLAGALYINKSTMDAPDDLAYKIYLALAKSMQYIRQTGTDSDEIAGIVATATGSKPENIKLALETVLFDPRIKTWIREKHLDEMQWYVDQKKLAKPATREEFYFEGYQEKALAEHPELFSDIEQYLQSKNVAPEELPA